jgi:hypothetical protein
MQPAALYQLKTQGSISRAAGFRVRVRVWRQHLDGAHAATEHSARYGIERGVGNKALLQKEGIEGRGREMSCVTLESRRERFYLLCKT